MIGARRILSITVLLFACFTIACENEKILFKGPYFVRFTDEAVTLKESYTPVINVQVHNAGPAPQGDVVINYSIGGTARQNVDYKILGTPGRVTIKSGEFFGNIQVQLINNSNNILRSQDLVLTLLTIENNDDHVAVGQGVSQIGGVFTLTIQDDCILGGNYYGVRSASDVPIDGLTISSSDCENYLLSDWDIYIANDSVPPGIHTMTFVDNGDNTISIPPQKDASMYANKNTIDGSGVVNPTTRVITLNVRLADLHNKPVYSFQLIRD